MDRELGIFKIHPAGTAGHSPVAPVKVSSIPGSAEGENAVLLFFCFLFVFLLFFFVWCFCVCVVFVFCFLID